MGLGGSCGTTGVIKWECVCGSRGWKILRFNESLMLEAG